MAGFNETMRRREKAEEDIYFARLDRQLIAELRHRAMLACECPEAMPATGESGPDASIGRPDGNDNPQPGFTKSRRE